MTALSPIGTMRIREAMAGSKTGHARDGESFVRVLFALSSCSPYPSSRTAAGRSGTQPPRPRRDHLPLHPGQRPLRLREPFLGEVAPLRVLRLDQRELPVPPPALDPLLPPDRLQHRRMGLEPDQPLAAVVLGEALE